MNKHQMLCALSRGSRRNVKHGRHTAVPSGAYVQCYGLAVNCPPTAHVEGLAPADDTLEVLGTSEGGAQLEEVNHWVCP